MTKKSLDNSAKRSGSGSITRHPAFPAVVALWFMVLLGFGGWLIPLALLERLAEASRLSSLVPAAAPPLGFTAKLIVALGLCATGALLGFVVARRITGAGPQDESELDTPPMSRARFDIATDLGADSNEATKHPLRRRRALSIDDLEPAVEKISPYAEPQDHITPAYTPAPDCKAEPTVVEVLPPEPGFREWRRAEEVFDEVAAIEMPVVEAASESIERAQAIMPASEPARPKPSEAQEWLVPEAPIEVESVVETTPELAVEPEPAVESEPELAVEPEPVAEFDPAPNPVPPATPGTPLDDLDITQLVERFADTVRRRREWLASTGQSRLSPIRPLALEPEIVPPAPVPPQTLPPLKEPTARRLPVFDWLQHLNVEPQGDVPAPGISVPVHTGAFVKAAPEQELDEPNVELEPEAERDGEDDAYGSLIEMKNPFALPRSDFIRIEGDETDPEVETDPAHEQEKAQERPDTADAEASLRAALAKLQQLSGNP